ncbi:MULTISPECIES: hypothetical protein [unclassified Microbacterium]|uniref:hypothetical protein n=1 Tax=unclassified Microbacterium TaxID=2609290 RepID=UPI00214B3CF3|nr:MULTISPECIES: hypothetical protein [unclassified Microbacterium]MCR2808807.1 hypothetical protein [Microbacterium sp. zg.B185]WIM18771.1 hypothetical protein QNO12_14440 [Microbacterium sp. zg-B185]
MRPRRAALTLAAASAVLIAALSGCVAEPGKTPTEDVAASDASASDVTPTASPPTATPSPEAGAVALPTDCRAILTADVLSQLADVALNDPAAGLPTGTLADGTLSCVWGNPSAGTTYMMTQIRPTPRGQAMETLNTFADDEGYTCYTPDGGTRCEKTWPSEVFSDVIDGHTLFWRDEILIESTYSNLAPTGYTSAIVASIFG